MKLRALLEDEDGVSPVIGVILMVAITVILAAVIGTFVLGLGEQVQNTAPQASFGWDYTNADGGASDQLTITHKSGDSLTATQISVVVNGAYATDVDGDSNGGSTDPELPYDVSMTSSNSWNDLTGESEISAGSSTTLADGQFVFTDGIGTQKTLPAQWETSGSVTDDGNDEHLELDSATVKLVWSGETGDTSAVLSEWTGPDA